MNRANERPKINQLLLNNDSRDKSIVVGVVVFVVLAIVVVFIIEIIFG